MKRTLATCWAPIFKYCVTKLFVWQKTHAPLYQSNRLSPSWESLIQSLGPKIFIIAIPRKISEIPPTLSSCHYLFLLLLIYLAHLLPIFINEVRYSSWVLIIQKLAQVSLKRYVEWCDNKNWFDVNLGVSKKRTFIWCPRTIWSWVNGCDWLVSAKNYIKITKFALNSMNTRNQLSTITSSFSAFSAFLHTLEYRIEDPGWQQFYPNRH